MTGDARFEDGGERPLRLRAEDADDLQVIAALVQDAVLPATEMTWDRRHRRFACLLNRFRWEDRSRAERGRRPFERAQALLSVEDALAVRTQGIDPRDRDTVLSLLTLAFEPGEDGTGRILLAFAGGGTVAIDVEAVNVTLQDVTRPYAAPSGQAPHHPD